MATVETLNGPPIATDAGPLGGGELARFRESMAKGQVPDLGTPAPVVEPAPPVETPPTPPASAQPEAKDEDGPTPRHDWWKDEHDPTTGKPFSNRQQYLNHQIRERTRLEVEGEQLRRELEELKRGTRVGAEPERPQYTRSMPAEDEVGSTYQTYGAYVRDLAAWEFEQRDAARTRADETVRTNDAHREAVTAYESTVVAARTRHADFDAVVSQRLPAPLTPTIQNAILASDIGAELAYHLSTHHNEYRSIRALPVGRALMALGALETQVRAAMTPTPAAPAPTPTPPPAAPMAPVNAGGIAGAPDVSSLNDLHTFRTVIKPKFGMRS